MRPNQTFKLYHNKGSHACIVSCFSHVQLFATPWTVACQPPLPMRFSRQEYWSVLPCPPSGDLPIPGIEPMSLMSLALAGGLFITSATWEVHDSGYIPVYICPDSLNDNSTLNFVCVC